MRAEAAGGAKKTDRDGHGQNRDRAELLSATNEFCSGGHTDGAVPDGLGSALRGSAGQQEGSGAARSRGPSTAQRSSAGSGLGAPPQPGAATARNGAAVPGALGTQSSERSQKRNPRAAPAPSPRSARQREEPERSQRAAPELCGAVGGGGRGRCAAERSAVRCNERGHGRERTEHGTAM